MIFPEGVLHSRTALANRSGDLRGSRLAERHLGGAGLGRHNRSGRVGID